MENKNLNFLIFRLNRIIRYINYLSWDKPFYWKDDRAEALIQYLIIHFVSFFDNDTRTVSFINKAYVKSIITDKSKIEEMIEDFEKMKEMEHYEKLKKIRHNIISHTNVNWFKDFSNTDKLNTVQMEFFIQRILIHLNKYVDLRGLDYYEEIFKHIGEHNFHFSDIFKKD